ncbi:MAG: DUF2752 domain-containing protein [Planctomycetes bacterium]|nr:DUF2752 domain-containing protein [Planctomycetota bacterium]
MVIRLRPKTETDFDHELVWGTIGLLVLLVARFVPTHLLPLRPCPFLHITGIPCPTCGMTRCFLAMSRQDVLAAWRFSPLGAVLYVLTVCYVVYAAIVLIGRLPRIRIRFRSIWELRALVAVIAAIAIANWIHLIVTWPPCP